MKNIKRFQAWLFVAVLSWTAVCRSQQGQYLPDSTLSDAVKASPVKWDITTGTLKVPLIAWGADMQTILANGNSLTTASGSIFDAKGLDIELYREDVFARQLDAYMRAETPFLRGTVGMINMAAEVAGRSPDTEMVVIYQLSWSAGGDALVVRENIARPADLKGRTVAVQAFGPHVDYLTTVLSSVGLTPSDISIRWVPDLFETGPNAFSPAMALQSDSSVDAAMVIIPDAMALTSGGSTGTGAEGSVRGAKIMLSTRTADRIISDVYAVRRDFYESNRGLVEKFVSGLLEAERELVAQARSRDLAWDALVASSAEILLDDRNAIEDMSAMLRDVSLAGLAGNEKFFHDSSYLRRFDILNNEIQQAFLDLGLIEKSRKLSGPDFRFETIVGGADGFGEMVEVTRFDPEAVAAIVSRKTQDNSLSDGEIYSFEIYFEPNQNSFPSSDYRKQFDQVMKLVSTYGGALLTIEGHSDPLGYLKQKQQGTPPMVLNKVRQSARNLSYNRASAVKDSLISYAESQGITLDPNQFGVVGHGIMRPNTGGVAYDARGDLKLASAPQSEDEWKRTRRVVFRLIQVEAEPTAFEPLF